MKELSHQTFKIISFAKTVALLRIFLEVEREKKKFLLQIPSRHYLFTHKRPCHLTLFFNLSFSLSLSLSLSLSPFHLPLSPPPPPLASPSPSTLHLPWIFPPFASSSPMGFSLTSLSPQLIASSISYLNSPLPTAPIIGDAALEIFFYPLCFYGGL
jgi:hypothetical protein